MRTPKSNPPPANLAGSLLLAHPVLRDPNFRRTVIMMSVHTEEGAMGVVLNRPMGKTLGELNGSFAYGPLAAVPVFSGGPVQTEQLILVGWQKRDDGFRLHFGIEPEQAGEIAADERSILRAYIGFAGWGGGQIETEMKRNTWVVTPMPPELMDLEPGIPLWKALLAQISPEWKLLSNEPDDSTFN